MHLWRVFLIFSTVINEANIYASGIMEDDGAINYPVSEKKTITPETYSRILDNIKDALKEMEFTEKSINSLLEILEANLSFVPSSTDSSQLCDISLFDHMKITAAVASAFGIMRKRIRSQIIKPLFIVKVLHFMISRHSCSVAWIFQGSRISSIQ